MKGFKIVVSSSDGLTESSFLSRIFTIPIAGRKWSPLATRRAGIFFTGGVDETKLQGAVEFRFFLRGLAGPFEDAKLHVKPGDGIEKARIVVERSKCETGVWFKTYVSLKLIY